MARHGKAPWPKIVRAIAGSARTVSELAAQSGASETGVVNVLRELQSEGLVRMLPKERPSEGRRGRANVWEWAK